MDRQRSGNENVGSDREVQRLNQVYDGYARDPGMAARWSDANAGNRAMAAERWQVLVAMLEEHNLLPPDGCPVLDVGCGSGIWLQQFEDLGAAPDQLWGVDLLAERIANARTLHPTYHLNQANAERLEFPNEFFGLVIVSTLFSSILEPSMAQAVAQEVERVLRPGGAVIWYDIRYISPRNRAVRPLGVEQVRSLFPTLELQIRPLTLLPPISRRLGRATPVLYPVLARCRPFRSHLCGLLLKPAIRQENSARS